MQRMSRRYSSSRSLKRYLAATKNYRFGTRSCRQQPSFSTFAIPTVEQQQEQPTVSTYRRSRISTQTVSHRIPLSIVDIHLRHEQLPFGYFFRETLDEQDLEDSLRSILKDFPQTGGVICQSHTAIQCHPDDTVHVSFGRINLTFDEWQQQPRGHLHESFSANSHSCNRGSHPVKG